MKAIEIFRKLAPLVDDLAKFAPYLDDALALYRLVRTLADKIRSEEGLTDEDRQYVLRVLNTDPRLLRLDERGPQ